MNVSHHFKLNAGTILQRAIVKPFLYKQNEKLVAVVAKDTLKQILNAIEKFQMVK